MARSKKPKEERIGIQNGHIGGPGAARLFNGSEEDKQEFLLKIINREITDRFDLPIEVNTMLRAFDKYDELDERKEAKKGSQGSTINIVVSSQGKSFDDSVFKKIDEERENKK